ncbi:MAG: DNA-deoxyinosine glycosylase [Butyrivibrio sp.]|nr:DNA-deoxyinosine glycosylase [Butyrivibrio sp.]
MKITHTFEPVYDSRSRVLILGTFPSVKSRESNFYYGHPQNRFWRVMAAVLSCAVPVTVSEKKEMLLEHKIALWDVVQSCEIEGSADASIRGVIPNRLEAVTAAAPVERIYANGSMAGKLYAKYCADSLNMDITVLPSTSPANAAFGLERLIEAWRAVNS